jgi:hypothetical protein
MAHFSEDGADAVDGAAVVASFASSSFHWSVCTDFRCFLKFEVLKQAFRPSPPRDNDDLQSLQ